VSPPSPHLSAVGKARLGPMLGRAPNAWHIQARGLAAYVMAYNAAVWEVGYTDEFEAWWDGLTPQRQSAVDERIELLRREGPNLKRP
jgi:hypothetical protein